MKNSILVTGIGGNVGQGILRNLRSLNNHFKLVGTDISSVTAGNHLCDNSYRVSYAYDAGYIDEIKKICETECIDLIIPTTDYEVYYLSMERANLPEMIANPAKTAATFLDKYVTWRQFSNVNIPFAKSFLPSEYDGQLEEIIVKPRKGRGSRGIAVNPKSLKEYSDDYMIQEYIQGKEITAAFYITKKNRVIGPITMERQLENGATGKCWVCSEYDERLSEIIFGLTEKFHLIGPNNIQARISSDNQIIPFEVNGRYSGTNSLRPHFGFNDVKMGVQEYLEKVEPYKPEIKKGGAMRILKDIIYPGRDTLDNLGNKEEHFYYY